MEVRRWRRVLEELAEDEVRDAERPSGPRAARTAAPEPDTVAALLAASLLGGRRARAAGERLAELLGAQTALRLRHKGGELVLSCVDRVLHAERDRRLAPLDALDVTPEPHGADRRALRTAEGEVTWWTTTGRTAASAGTTG
ncbi:dynamin family protein [Streptomyces tanashiensis]